jgi:hypothetical protein
MRDVALPNAASQLLTAVGNFVVLRKEMGRRGAAVIALIGVLLVLAVVTDWLTDLALLPFVVALHYLDRLLYWVNVVWRL